jgi:Clustered mitochondria/Zinc finger, ZZ type/Translation initiation factor eIF3 subunit 135
MTLCTTTAIIHDHSPTHCTTTIKISSSILTLFKHSTSLGMSVHKGFLCDGCEAEISGTRWKCAVCVVSFDLCNACYQILRPKLIPPPERSLITPAEPVVEPAVVEPAAGEPAAGEPAAEGFGVNNNVEQNVLDHHAPHHLFIKMRVPVSRTADLLFQPSPTPYVPAASYHQQLEFLSNQRNAKTVDDDHADADTNAADANTADTNAADANAADTNANDILAGHAFVQCSNCYVSLENQRVRYACTCCNNYDLCAECESVFDEVHHVQHPVLEILYPIRSPFDASPLRPLAAGETDTLYNGVIEHAGFSCDGACESPITGTRYKCITRADYDLCENCFNSLGPNDFPEHSFVEIVRPLPQQFPRIPCVQFPTFRLDDSWLTLAHSTTLQADSEQVSAAAKMASHVAHCSHDSILLTRALEHGIIDMLMSIFCKATTVTARRCAANALATLLTYGVTLPQLYLDEFVTAHRVHYISAIMCECDDTDTVRSCMMLLSLLLDKSSARESLGLELLLQCDVSYWRRVVMVDPTALVPTLVRVFAVQVMTRLVCMPEPRDLVCAYGLLVRMLGIAEHNPPGFLMQSLTQLALCCSTGFPLNVVVDLIGREILLSWTAPTKPPLIRTRACTVLALEHRHQLVQQFDFRVVSPEQVTDVLEHHLGLAAAPIQERTQIESIGLAMVVFFEIPYQSLRLALPLMCSGIGKSVLHVLFDFVETVPFARVRSLLLDTLVEIITEGELGIANENTRGALLAFLVATNGDVLERLLASTSSLGAEQSSTDAIHSLSATQTLIWPQLYVKMTAMIMHLQSIIARLFPSIAADVLSRRTYRLLGSEDAKLVNGVDLVCALASSNSEVPDQADTSKDSTTAKTPFSQVRLQGFSLLNFAALSEGGSPILELMCAPHVLERIAVALYDALPEVQLQALFSIQILASRGMRERILAAGLLVKPLIGLATTSHVPLGDEPSQEEQLVRQVVAEAGLTLCLLIPEDQRLRTALREHPQTGTLHSSRDQYLEDILSAQLEEAKLLSRPSSTQSTGVDIHVAEHEARHLYDTVNEASIVGDPVAVETTDPVDDESGFDPPQLVRSSSSTRRLFVHHISIVPLPVWHARPGARTFDSKTSDSKVPDRVVSSDELAEQIPAQMTPMLDSSDTDAFVAPPPELQATVVGGQEYGVESSIQSQACIDDFYSSYDSYEYDQPHSDSEADASVTLHDVIGTETKVSAEAAAELDLQDDAAARDSGYFMYGDYIDDVPSSEHGDDGCSDAKPYNSSTDTDIADDPSTRPRSDAVYENQYDAKHNDLETAPAPAPAPAPALDSKLPSVPSRTDNSATPARDWNAEFQLIRDKFPQTIRDNLRVNSDLRGILHQFRQTAIELGKRIILECDLPARLKTIKPLDVGGVAGGEKFLAGGVFFKLVRHSDLYATYELAADVARHELNGLNAVSSALVSGLHTGLMVILDYAGHRLIASSMLPVDGSTLCYGSADAARTVRLSDSRLNVLMRILGQKLLLKPHIVGQTSKQLIYGPADIEGHLGHDGRYYVLDTSRLFPPEAMLPRDHPYADCTQRQRGGVLAKLLRPQLLKSFGQALSSDAFTGFGRHDAAIHNAEVVAATKHMFDVLIPRVADEIDVGMFSLRTPNATPSYITSLMHANGINVRHMGALRSMSQNATARRVILLAMISRVIKNQLRQQNRQCVTRESNAFVEQCSSTSATHTNTADIDSFCNHIRQQLRKQTLDTLNVIFGTSPAADEFWCTTIKHAVVKKFAMSLTEEEHAPEYDLRHSIPSKAFLLVNLYESVHVRISNECIAQVLGGNDVVDVMEAGAIDPNEVELPSMLSQLDDILANTAIACETTLDRLKFSGYADLRAALKLRPVPQDGFFSTATPFSDDDLVSIGVHTRNAVFPDVDHEFISKMQFDMRVDSLTRWGGLGGSGVSATASELEQQRALYPPAFHDSITELLMQQDADRRQRNVVSALQLQDTVNALIVSMYGGISDQYLRECALHTRALSDFRRHDLSLKVSKRFVLRMQFRHGLFSVDALFGYSRMCTSQGGLGDYASAVTSARLCQYVFDTIFGDSPQVVEQATQLGVYSLLLPGIAMDEKMPMSVEAFRHAYSAAVNCESHSSSSAMHVLDWVGKMLHNMCGGQDEANPLAPYNAFITAFSNALEVAEANVVAQDVAISTESESDAQYSEDPEPSAVSAETKMREPGFGTASDGDEGFYEFHHPLTFILWRELARKYNALPGLMQESARLHNKVLESQRAYFSAKHKMESIQMVDSYFHVGLLHRKQAQYEECLAAWQQCTHLCERFFAMSPPGSFKLTHFPYVPNVYGEIAIACTQYALQFEQNACTIPAAGALTILPSDCPDNAAAAAFLHEYADSSLSQGIKLIRVYFEHVVEFVDQIRLLDSSYRQTCMQIRFGGM